MQPGKITIFTGNKTVETGRYVDGAFHNTFEIGQTTTSMLLAKCSRGLVSVKVIPLVENEPIGRRKRRPVPTRAASVKALQEALGITNA